MRKSRIASLILSLSAGVVLAGCGGGAAIVNNGAGGTSGGGTTTGGPTSLLSGKYAFTFTGSATDTGDPIVAVGSFTADGNGNITTGVEDLNIPDTVGGIQTGKAITGTYTIGTDGRGTLNFTSITQTFKIVVETNGHGQMIRFDSGASASGTFDLQSNEALTSLQQGPYVFGWNGFSFDTAAEEFVPYSGLGNVGLSGSSASGAMDYNYGGDIAYPTVSASFNSPDTNGHGTASVTLQGVTTPYTFSYVVVSATRVLLMETDTSASVIGEADAQSSSTLTPSGAYALSLNGVFQGEYGLVGQIVVGAPSAGVSTISSSDVVQNNEGSYVNGTYPGSLTANNLSGAVNNRFVLSATEPTGTTTDTFAVYMISANQAMIMEEDANGLSYGQMLTQTATTFTSGSLNGNYGINFLGLDANTYEGDVVGQIVSGGSSTLTAGTLDINDEDASPTTFPNNLISGGTYTVVNGTTGHGTLSFTTTATSSPFQFNFYFVSPNQIFLVETDTLFVGIGSAQIQPTIP